MSLAARMGALATWRPLNPGSRPPLLSLTADDGTWVRLPDFVGESHVVLVFFRRADDRGIQGWLQRWDAARDALAARDSHLYGISTARPDELRGQRDRLGLGFPLLYDPLAVDARAFRASSRWRPICKNTVVLVGKDGAVAWTARGLADPDSVLAELDRLQGTTATTAATGGVVDIDSARAVELLELGGGEFVLVDVRTHSEYEADHAPWAVHIPVDELPQRYGELGQTNKVICVCQAGSRSAAAAEFLVSIGGTDIHNVLGGMSSWSGPRVTGGVAQ
jgi:rhodanese-related sulfurtransferase/peroxiredoxin